MNFKKYFLIIFFILFIQSLTAQVISKDSLWIDDFFDTFDLVIIPEYSFIYSDFSINDFEGKTILKSYGWQNDKTFTMQKTINIDMIPGSSLSLGLKSDKMDVSARYFFTLNMYDPNSFYTYDAPYYIDGNKIGELDLTIGQLQVNTHYWFTYNYGIGLEYDLSGSNLKIAKIIDDSDGLVYQSIASFNISQHLVYLYAPLKYRFKNTNFNALLAISLFATNYSSSTLIETDPQFSKDFNSPFGFKFHLGVNTELFNWLPVGIKYRFNYLASKGEYSFITNTISLQIGIPSF